MQKLYTNNRERFFKQMDKNSLAIFVSNQEVISNGDALYPFKQNSNILWLCGISQAETSVILHKTKTGKVVEYLFIKKPNPLKEIWDGRFLSLTEAEAISGIKTICFSNDLESFLQGLLPNVETLYLDSNENDRKGYYFYSADYQFIDKIKKEHPLHQTKRAALILKSLRSIKNHFEVSIIQHAIDITNNTFHHLLHFIGNNIYEYEIQAEIISSFLKQKSSGYAFSPIIASGDNARILHYTSNNNQCKDGELVLIDFGASFNSYNADITRTIPVNGTFTKRQKEIYNACLRLNKYAQSLLKPNVLLSTYTQMVGAEASKELLKLGLLKPSDIKNEDKKNPAYRKFLYHGISHHLGIDVHDLADKEAPLDEGMVLTVEPGIYVEEEKIGVRLENNVLITKTGNKNLSKNIPIEADDIERLMKKK